MWDILCNLINSDPTVGGAIASFIGNTLSTTLSDGLKKLFRKKHEVKELKIEDCKQLIEEKDLAAILEEIKKLRVEKEAENKTNASMNVYNAEVNYNGPVNNFYGNGPVIFHQP